MGSGGQNKIEFAPEQVEDIRHRYVDLLEGPISIGKSYDCSGLPIRRVLRGGGWLRPRGWSQKLKHHMLGKERPEHSELMKGENNPFYGRSWSEPELAESLDEMKASFPDRFGENNPNWKGGFSALSHLYNDHRYTLLKRKALRRDGHRCRACGSDEHLEFHHIYNAKEYPEEFFDLDNVITLCRRCHRTKTYRRENECIEWCLMLLNDALLEPSTTMGVIARGELTEVIPDGIIS